MAMINERVGASAHCHRSRPEEAGASRSPLRRDNMRRECYRWLYPGLAHPFKS